MVCGTEVITISKNDNEAACLAHYDNPARIWCSIHRDAFYYYYPSLRQLSSRTSSHWHGKFRALPLSLIPNNLHLFQVVQIISISSYTIIARVSIAQRSRNGNRSSDSESTSAESESKPGVENSPAPLTTVELYHSGALSDSANTAPTDSKVDSQAISGTSSKEG